MNVTLTSLEALILKATHESLPCPDAAALEAFCTIMKDSPEGPVLAAQALAARIHTPNGKEALLALTMLDRCMRRGDAAFHAEVGKFRFLNELIKLVSPKYFAERTAPEVRIMVLQLLHAWSIEYTKESKFKVAYDMLRNQGVVKETPPPLPSEDTTPPRRTRSAIFENEEKSKMLQKLLQSKKPEDILHANKLIKTMVREEERRNEASSRRAQEVSSALDSAGLLRDMLERSADATPDEQQLIHELRARCARMRPTLQKLAAADVAGDSLGDILHACDALDEVFEKYNMFATKNKDKPTRGSHTMLGSQSEPSHDSLLDLAGAGDGGSRRESNVIDELGDIFTSDGPSIAEPLKPLSLTSNDDIDLLGDKPSKKEAWSELDSLGEQLLKQSLPANAKRGDNFSKQSKKIPMNALEISPKDGCTPNSSGALLDLDFFNKKPASIRRALTPVDDIMVDISTDTHNIPASASCVNKPNSPLDKILDFATQSPEVNGTTKVEKGNENHKRTEVTPLTDINVSLENVQPSAVPPLVSFEEEGGITVTLHLCKDRPRRDVHVIVISTTSKSKSPIEDYKFQAVVPKGCKTRLLPASGTSLPAYNPFLPPPALTQVMLIAKPLTFTTPLSLKFVLTYVCDDDTCSEMGEVKMLPLDDV